MSKKIRPIGTTPKGQGWLVQKKLTQKLRESDSPHRVTLPLLPSDGPLLGYLRDIATVCVSRGVFKEARRQAVCDLQERIANLKQNDKHYNLNAHYLIGEFSRLDLNLEEELVSRFRAEDSKGKEIILKFLLIIENGTSAFIARILEKGKSDSRFNDVKKFIESIDRDEFRKFMYNFIPYDTSKIETLAESLLSLKGKKGMAPLAQSIIDLETSNSADLMILNAKQLLYIMLKKHSSIPTTLTQAVHRFTNAISWNSLDAAAELIMDKFGNDASKIFYGLAEVNNEKFDLPKIKRAAAIRYFAKVKKEQAVDTIRQYLAEEHSPLINFFACDALVTFCGEEGMRLVENIIEDDIQKERPSLMLACLIVNSDGYGHYDDILRRIFSKDINLTEELLRIPNSKLKIPKGIDYWLKVNYEKLTLPKMTACIGMEGRFTPWITQGGDTPLGQNAKMVLQRAIELDDDQGELIDVIARELHAGQDGWMLKKWIGKS